MGAELFRRFPETTQFASDALGYCIETLCREDPNKTLNETQYTQPALFTVNALYTYALQAESNMTPDFVAGHSLGEYNALLAAGVFDFETGLRLTQKRGRLMAEAKNGGMLAVMVGEAEAEAVLSDAGLSGVDAANFNTPSQTVLAGPKAELETARAAFAKRGAAAIPLPVSAAFHSRYMRPAGEIFAQDLAQVQFNSPNLPVIANATAEVYPDDPRDLLSRQISAPVRWEASMNRLLTAGVVRFIEIGPKPVLGRLLQAIAPQNKVA